MIYKVTQYDILKQKLSYMKKNYYIGIIFYKNEIKFKVK